MSQERFKLSHVWKQTLEEQRKDAHSDSRNRLRQAFLSFRERAAKLAGEIPRDLPFFTVHDVTHLDALWEMIDLVAGPNYPITPAEAFVLGGAILVHDLAMSQAAYQNELVRLKSESVWRDTVASLLRARFGRSPTGAEIASPDTETEQAAVQNLLRVLHARQAAALLTKEWGYGGTTYYLLDDADLRAAFADDIGKVAFSHHWPLDKLLDATILPQSPAGGPGWLPPEWSVDLVKLGCLLRIADAVHCDDRRAPGFLAALRQPTGVSDQHWKFQNLLRKPHREDGADRIRYRSSRPFSLNEFESWWVAFDWLRMADGELRAVDALLADTGRDRFLARGVFNVDHPSRMALDVRTEGWEPVDAEIRVPDIPRLVRTLGGTQLYGNRPEVPLRELIQNSADAIRARRKLQSRDISFGKIVVRPSRDATEQTDWIEVEDNGVGMSKATLTGTLLDFGTAFWGTHRMRQEFPGLEARGMEATGRFGIGFFSVFMWGNRVTVLTRRYDRGYDESWVLEFRGGVQVRPLLRRATVEEQSSLPDGGTRVRVWCDPGKQIPRALLRREPTSETTCSWVELCAWLAPALDVSLDVDINGISQAAVIGNDWLTINAEQLMLRLNQKGHTNARAAIQHHAAFWNISSILLQVVFDDYGNAVARGTVWAPEAAWYSQGCTVCGGIRADSGVNFLGIRFAEPETVTRHATRMIVHDAGWKKWAEEQMQVDKQVAFPPELRALAAIRLIPFVHPGDLPFGRTQRGWVSIAEFAESFRTSSRFRCVATTLWAAQTIIEQYQDMPTVIVHGQHVLNQLDGRMFSIINVLKDAAVAQWKSDCEVSNLNRGTKSDIINGELVLSHVIEFYKK